MKSINHRLTSSSNAKFITAFLLIAYFLFNLQGCSRHQLGSTSGMGPIRNLAPPHQYFKQARQVSEENSTDRHGYILLAAESLIAKGYLKKATEELRRLPLDELTVEQADVRLLLYSQIAHHRKQYRRALSLLAKIDNLESLSPTHQVLYYEQKANSYKHSKRYANAANTYLKLLNFNFENRNPEYFKQIFYTLSQLPRSQRDAIAQNPEHSLSSWLSLFQIIQRAIPGSNQQVLSELSAWKNRYPNHPYTNRINIDSFKGLNSSGEKAKVALVLPLRGPLSTPAKLIREGFLNHYLQKQMTHHVEVEVVDSTTHESTSSLMSALAKENFEYVIGPLEKKKVREYISAARSNRLKIITLNQEYGQKNQNNSALLFGLSSPQNTDIIIEHAKEAKLARAALITPKSKWGRDIADAFSKKWVASGGRLIKHLEINTKRRINKLEIKNFLQLTDSEQRIKALKSRLKRDFKSIPRRRQDIDFILLAATQKQARQLRPLINFYYGHDIPIYGLSAIHNTDSRQYANKDLNGIIFPEIPGLRKLEQMPLSPKYKKLLAHSNNFKRLYAIGFDAYSLVENYSVLKSLPYIGFNGLTGYIALDNSNHAQPHLSTAQYSNGRIRMIQ